MRYRRDPRPPAIGLADEDNFQIEVWDREDGQLLGIALRTSMSGVMHEAWRDAVEAYPGKYLVWTNGPFLIQAVVSPTGTPDQLGWIEADDIRLADVPQWFGLVTMCKCNRSAFIDRYEERVARWKHCTLGEIAATKLNCIECTKKGRKPVIKLGLRKLPR